MFWFLVVCGLFGGCVSLAVVTSKANRTQPPPSCVGDDCNSCDYYKDWVIK